MTERSVVVATELPGAVREIAFGPLHEAFTDDLLQRAYGGRLNVLSEVADLSPLREAQRELGIKGK